MIIDVSSVLKEFGGKTEFEGEVNVGALTFSGGEYSFREPLSVRGSVINAGGGALSLKADVDGVMTTQCARCMKDIDVPVSFKLLETLMKSDDAAGVSGDDDVIVFDGNEIELDTLVENSFIINLEPRYLCRDDCRGLCPKCGADLNEGDCGCGEDDIDPRWVALADMIKNED